MHDSPEFATEVGYPGLNDRWSDQSLDAITRRQRELQAPLAVVKSIRRAKLSSAEQLNYDLFQRNLDEAIEGTRFKVEYLPLTQLIALHTRPTLEIEALSLHESVPGHHLQIVLAQELAGVPEFRKHSRHTAFVEGWGLYAESLGLEMGFYQDPCMKFGQLVYEIWRAIRLVLDTGLHAKGWTRQQAIDYFLANASKNQHDITVEVDRYIVWPGQALAYKIGELKIKELRAYATKELGDKFDVRQFHDQVLGNAAVPLDVLEVRIKQWIASRR